ncbi:hypothetical protein [Niastella sp. OAS944]|uniref:DUF6934 family protein n=1 Tax=Niastella sp. OAS944 TaxID=2664089 RepID=UPI0034953DFD|nr:hypothetical protein [Chitinophagaceae bacterium OAS944]
MSNLYHRYDITETSDEVSTNFLFFSKGGNEEEEVPKIIQFTYIRDYKNTPVYNLGFGDFDMNTGFINDEAMSDNGDVYRVFNTVLSTVPFFFEKYPNAALLVRGSDGRTEYEFNCKQNCKRKCIDLCHNFNRRMRLYCNYVSRKHGLLRVDYQFLGGYANDIGWFDFTEFDPGSLYECIIVSGKSLNLIYEAR